MAEPRGRLESRWTAVGGRLMHALVSVDPMAADCPPVVLVHGLSVSSRYLVPTAVRLAPYCEVYAPDLPGFGKSGKPPHVLNVAGLADALNAWMKAVGLDRAALLGNSFGCQVIADLALRYPERVSRAVLVGPSIDRQGRTALRQAARGLLDLTREPLSLWPILIGDYLAAGIGRTLGTLRYALEDRIEEKLPHVKVPTLVVRGARDAIVPQRWAEEVTRLLPAGRLVVIPGAAHAVNYDAPAALVRVVRPFLHESERRNTITEAA